MEAENFEVCLGLRVGDVNLEIFIASPYDVLKIIVSPIPYIYPIAILASSYNPFLNQILKYFTSKPGSRNICSSALEKLRIPASMKSNSWLVDGVWC